MGFSVISVSTIRGDELFVGGFGGLGREDRRRNQDAIAERGAGMWGQREIQLFFTVTENFLAKRICGEEAIAAGVPIGGEAGVLRVIENRDGGGREW